jgi:hypothetical protein
MLKARDRLADVQLASPCTASWADMAGTERVRFCRECQRNVYNLSAMSRAEAEELVHQRETQRLCIRFYRRADGTLLTADCPVGVRKLRRAARQSWAVLVGSMAAVLALFFWASGRSKTPGGVRQVEPFASLFAWLDPRTPEPEAGPPPAKPPDPLLDSLQSMQGWRTGW